MRQGRCHIFPHFFSPFTTFSIVVQFYKDVFHLFSAIFQPFVLQKFWEKRKLVRQGRCHIGFSKTPQVCWIFDTSWYGNIGKGGFLLFENIFSASLRKPINLLKQHNYLTTHDTVSFWYLRYHSAAGVPCILATLAKLS